MLKTSDTEYLEQRRDIITEVETVKQERDQRIRDLLKQGASPTELAKTSGLTRVRIYQIAKAQQNVSPTPNHPSH